MVNHHYYSLQNPDITVNPVSHLLPGSRDPPEYSSVESPPNVTLPAAKRPGFFPFWLATSSSLRPTGDPTDIAWGIQWHTPVSIIFLLLLGTSAAILHHLIYSNLHLAIVGDATRQRWTLWLGSGLSFLTKVALTAALGISRTQWVWLTMRRKWMTLDSIDSLFGIISNPTLFSNWTMIRQAKVATVMAIAMWAFPLAAILTPGTISVKTISVSRSVDCDVPTLLFGFDRDSNATTPTWGEDVEVLDFGSWNLAKKLSRDDLRYIPSLLLAAYTGTVTPLPSMPDMRSLGVSGCTANSTYTIEFVGPTVTCASHTTWDNSTYDNSTSYLDRPIFRADEFEWSNSSFMVTIQNKVFKTPPFGFMCESSTARYTVQHTIQDCRFREPVITNVEKVKLADFQPKPIFPVTTYLPCLSLVWTIAELLQGVLGNGHGTSDSRNTSFMLDILSNRSNVGKAIELLSQKMMVSMVAFNLTHEGRQHVLNLAAIQKTTCHTTENVPVYIYSPQTLLIVYGLAIACALATSVAGFIALGHNGMASTKAISAIIRTTRNRTLDECIVGGDCLGGDVMSSELSKVKLRFGALKTAGKTGTAPFALGVRGEVFPIKWD